jgi:outer membrane protein assembly factor BamA
LFFILFVACNLAGAVVVYFFLYESSDLLLESVDDVCGFLFLFMISSLSHTFLYDTRDDKLAATRGAYGKFFQELAGLGTGGDAQFYKVEMEGQVSREVKKTGVVHQ